MQRHTSKRPVAFGLTSTHGQRVTNYMQRAQEELRLEVQVHDLGIRAQGTVNACLWLSMAAALSRPAWRPTSRYRGALSGLQATRDASLPVDVNEVWHSEIALFTVQLRTYMCGGPHVKIYQAFASLAGEGRASSSCWGDGYCFEYFLSVASDRSVVSDLSAQPCSRLRSSNLILSAPSARLCSRFRF